MRERRLLRILLTDLPVKVICLAAAVILLLFHRVTALTERFFSVPLDVNTPSGLVVASSYPKTVRITLRGSEDAIFPILEEDVEASVNLDGHRVAGVYRADVKVSRKGTAQNVEPLEIRVDPQEITFTLEPLTERRVNLIPDLRGAPAYGYEMVRSSLAPPGVTIRGARSQVQSITALPTEEIDLTGRTASFTSRVRVITPNSLVRVAGDPVADFRATIQETTVARTFDGVEVTAIDLSPHFLIDQPLGTGTVKVQGTQLLVDGIRPDQVRLVIDLASVKRAGEYVFHPRPAVPSSVGALDWSPREVTVSIVSSSGR